MTKVFFDTEFTGLHQDTTLISIGCVSEDGKTFYAESNEYDLAQVDDWLRQNVISHLFGSADAMSRADPHIDMAFRSNEEMIAHGLRQWLSQWKSVEMWSDCYAYDWVLFCELFGGAFGIPQNVYYIPFDLATLLKLRGIDPDIDRQEYATIGEHRGSGRKHNALQDARLIRSCYLRAMAV